MGGGIYVIFLLLTIGPGAGGTGAESEQKIAVILVLLFARLQLRLQLRCVRLERVEDPDYLLLHLHRRYGDNICIDHLQVKAASSSIT